MLKLYSFLLGPGLTISLLVFVIGLVVRLILYFKGLDWRLDRVAYKPHMAEGMKGGIYSMLKWLFPFATHGWRAQPFATICFFLLHLGAVLVPLFLLGHNEILKMQFGFSFWTLPQWLADFLTLATIGGIFLILLRRLSLPEVRILTTKSDYFLLALVAVPFITGLMARMPDSGDMWIVLHMLSGEIMLVLAPFTKLSHIVLYFASRWQIGADFSIKRGGHNRGPYFPW